MSSLVWPFRSWSVVQVGEPAACASTNTKSQFASVSRLIQKDMFAPPAGTAIVRASRLYDGWPTWEIANCVPVRAVPVGSQRSGSNASQILIPLCL